MTVNLLDGDGEANRIVTNGFMSNGIVARSVGGGGGDGAVGLGASFLAGLGVGGSGSKGGDGDTVTVMNELDITTTGSLSNGIIAQSIGGGGGDGGTAIAVEAGILTAGVTIGGFGDGGGAAKEVKVTNDANIAVHGAGSKAIIAQAIGGGGGKGGAGYSLSATVGIPTVIPGGAANVVIGGTGGGGGDGAKVTVESTGSLTSDGNATVFTRDGAIHGGGILAQSIGGGGGAGGIAEAKSFGAFTAIDVGIAIGGQGEVGGDGKEVTVNTFNTSSTAHDKITTVGFNAVGILAQSIGGGGGAGGRADTWQKQLIGDMSNPSLTAGVSIGGSACKPVDPPPAENEPQCQVAHGGTVTVDNQVDIETTGLFSHGMVAESIGGGGGIGGSAMSFSDTDNGGTTNLKANVAVGGSAGGGGNGGEASATNSGNITTHRSFSYGIWVHSVGGGGGGGGSADADLIVGDGAGKTYAGSVGVGGTGGQGGNGGKVTVDNSGTIITGMLNPTTPDAANGFGSVGILAQSVGGGGGTGGASKSAVSGGVEGALGLSIGGNGNASGDGGTVQVTNSGAVTTGGDGAHAIAAQSIGGGGGMGGTASAGTDGRYEIGGGFGGAGGGGHGTGGSVTVASGNKLTTFGREAYGILAQSIGGGGGAGGLGSTNGGSGEVGVSASIGGQGGSSGDGGDVTVTNNGQVETGGLLSHGIVAQSIGGGGGAGGGSSANGQSDNTIGGSLAGGGGDLRNSGNVKVINAVDASIKTCGIGAYGILAQSIGGGGGAGGTAAATTAGSLGIGLSLGGTGGAGGNSGNCDPSSAIEFLRGGDRHQQRIDRHGRCLGIWHRRPVDRWRRWCGWRRCRQQHLENHHRRRLRR